MPDTQPLPTAIFINHFTELPLTAKPCNLDNITPFQVNSMTTEGVLEAFSSFIALIIDDIQKNRRTDEALMDEMWDESIKMRTNTNIASRVGLIEQRENHA